MKKTIRWKLLFLILVTVVAGYYLIPTISRMRKSSFHRMVFFIACRKPT